MADTNVLPVDRAPRAPMQRVPKITLIARRYAATNPPSPASCCSCCSRCSRRGPLPHPVVVRRLDFLALKDRRASAHWLGTDIVGADMFALCVRGLGRSLLIGVIASLGVTVIAAFVGTAVAYFEGWREKVGVWIIDMMLVIPTFFLLAIMVKGASGTNGWLWLTAALTIFGWVGYGRILRSLARSLARARVRRRRPVHGRAVVHDPAPAHDPEFGLDPDH